LCIDDELPNGIRILTAHFTHPDLSSAPAAPFVLILIIWLQLIEQRELRQWQINTWKVRCQQATNVVSPPLVTSFCYRYVYSNLENVELFGPELNQLLASVASA
jgi:hypothetical protein